MSPQVLLVEDNPATTRMVRFVLKKAGYTLLEAADGATAIELLATHRPKLVLQDLVLPDIDGFALVERLRRAAGNDEVTILAFSGLVTRLEEARISAVGFDGIITKPIEPSRLLAIVEAHLPIALPAAERFGAGKTLILLDDDPMQRNSTRARLARFGFEVIDCLNPDLLPQMIRRTKADGVVADVLSPEVDGYDVCASLRKTDVSSVAVFLVTSSFIDPADRALAKRAGATTLVLRTPDLRELTAALASYFRGDPISDAGLVAPTEGNTPDRAKRAMSQLERQLLNGSGLARRCSTLSAELTVLAGISEVLLKHRDLEAALDDALTVCFDAGGVSEGAIYLLEPNGRFKMHHLGVQSRWSQHDLRPFEGHDDELLALIQRSVLSVLPIASVPPKSAAESLARGGNRSLMVVPLVHLSEPLGALMMVTRSSSQEEPDWQTFAQGVGNQITQLLALARAFKERETAEQALLASRAEWKALVEQVPDLILKMDTGGVIRFVNRPIPGCTVEEMIGATWVERVGVEHQASMRAAIEAVLATRESTRIEVSTLCPRGETVWYSTHLGPIMTEHHISGVVMIARDITQKKQADAQVYATDRLASVGTLAAGVAHEINNPLAAVIANLDLMMRKLSESTSNALTRELSEGLSEARAGAERVRLIVRDLKTFSRPDEETREPIDIRQTIEATLRLARNEIRHRARLIVDHGTTPRVMANASRLGQVFLNLLVNAAQAIPEGGGSHHVIRIKSWTDASGNAVVSVSDTGAGIPPEIRARLFTPFVTTKPIGIGTGLGLSICHRIIRDIDGEILVESEEGVGTEFKVVMPATHEPLSAPKIEIARPTSSTRRGKILVVDDEPTITHAIRRTLRADHEIVEENSARLALDRFKDGQRFDVILCDLMMPQMTGMELYEAVQEHCPDQAARMIFLTGGAFTPWAQQFLDRVENLRIDKPFEIASLRALVAEMVG